MVIVSSELKNMKKGGQGIKRQIYEQRENNTARCAMLQHATKKILALEDELV